MNQLEFNELLNLVEISARKGVTTVTNSSELDKQDRQRIARFFRERIKEVCIQAAKTFKFDQTVPPPIFKGDWFGCDGIQERPPRPRSTIQPSEVGLKKLNQKFLRSFGC